MRKENNGRRSFENRSAQCSFTGISGKEVEPWNSQGIAETGRERTPGRCCYSFYVCDNLQVAEKFGKRHDNVLQAIDGLRETLLKIEERSELFCVSRRKANDGQYHRMYLMNRDGFSLLVMRFTGKNALEWKLQYVRAFNQMAKLIQEKNATAYQIAEQVEKATGRAETDVIKEFVEYARAQGSTHTDHYYSNCTRLAYKTVGITDKATAASSQLDDLSLVEHLIAHTLRTGMAAGHSYRDIYQTCKEQLKAMQYLQCTA